MKLTPASNAASTIRCASAASVRSPKVMFARHSTETSSPLSPRRRNSMFIDSSLRRPQALHVRDRKRTAQHRLAKPLGRASRAFRDDLGRHLQVVVVVHVEAVVAVIPVRVETRDKIRKRIAVRALAGKDAKMPRCRRAFLGRPDV